MTEWEFSHIPFDGDSSDDKIVCQNCGWSWKVKDGGDDLYICHKCGFNNEPAYSNFVDATAIAGAVGDVAGAFGDVAKAKASKEASKLNIQKELEAVCGKKKGRRKKKQSYEDCKKNYLATLSSKEKLLFEEQQKQTEFQRQAYLQSQKNKKITTIVVVGVFAVIVAFAIYKNRQK
jgi:hypothetical protein